MSKLAGFLPTGVWVLSCYFLGDPDCPYAFHYFPTCCLFTTCFFFLVTFSEGQFIPFVSSSSPHQGSEDWQGKQELTVHILRAGQKES
jgi:hypothetical protein